MLDVSESAESIEIKLTSCRETLNDLEVDPARVLLVLNKVDLLDAMARRRIDGSPMFKEYSTAKVSASRGDGIRQLSNKILERTAGFDKQTGRRGGV